MSYAKKCDRCGALFEPYDYQNIGEAWRYSVLRDNHPYEENRLDLCNSCRIELEKWIKKGGTK